MYGKEDDDGFFYGECNGRSGYIPCNMVSELQADDPEVVKQLLMSEQPAQSTDDGKHHSSSHHKKKSSTAGATSSSTTRTTTSTSKPSSSSSKQQQQQQSTPPLKTKDSQQQQQFAPISNQYGKSGPQPAAAPKNLMVALYDYDPQSLSPNVDSDVR